MAFGELKTRLTPTRRQRSARRASSLSGIPERYIDGREGPSGTSAIPCRAIQCGSGTQLVEEAIDGEKTGMWVCPCCGRPYAKQFIDDTASVGGGGPHGTRLVLDLIGLGSGLVPR